MEPLSVQARVLINILLIVVGLLCTVGLVVLFWGLF